MKSISLYYKSGQNRGFVIGDFFVPCDLKIWRTTLKNNRAPLLFCVKRCASFHSHQWFQTGVTVRKRPIFWIKIDDFFVSRDLEIWQMILKNNKAYLLFCLKLCASFQSHWWIQIGVTARKRPIWVIIDFFSLVALRFVFLHHFIIICEFKLELSYRKG